MVDPVAPGKVPSLTPTRPVKRRKTDKSRGDSQQKHREKPQKSAQDDSQIGTHIDETC